MVNWLITAFSPPPGRNGMPRLPSLITRWLAAINLRSEEFKSSSERRRCQRQGNQNRVREEESERKWWWVNADSGETTREIKQATSAIGSLSHPFSSRSWLLFPSKTLWPSLPSLPLFLPSSFLPMSHLPGFHSPNQNYSGCHCLLDSLPLVWSPLPQQIDQRRAGPPTDCLIRGNNKN